MRLRYLLSFKVVDADFILLETSDRFYCLFVSLLLNSYEPISYEFVLLISSYSYLMKLSWFYTLFWGDDDTAYWFLLNDLDHYYWLFWYLRKFWLLYSSMDCNCNFSLSAKSACWLYFYVSSSIILITLSVITSCLIPPKAKSSLFSLYSTIFSIIWPFLAVYSLYIKSLLLFFCYLPFWNWLRVN